MESIKELKKICQNMRRVTDDWYMWHVLRKISVRVTWLLLHTPINANGVTFLFIVMGFVTCLVFLCGTKPAFFIGALMLQFWYVLDMVDGEVARYRKESVATGRFFDYMAHYIVHPWFFIAIGLGLYWRYGSFTIFICSIVAGHSVHLVDALLDVSSSVLYRRLKSKLMAPDKKIVFQRIEEKNEVKGEGSEGKGPVLKKIFSILHKVSTFPTIIYIMLPVSVVNLFVRSELFFAWIIFYAVVATLVWVARLVVFIRQKRVDIEYTQIDQLLSSWGTDQS